MKLHKPRTVTELINILSKYKAPKISFENLPEVDFENVSRTLLNQSHPKIDISNWDTSKLKKAIGFGIFLERHVEYDDDTLANLDFSNLEYAEALFARTEFNKPHHFVFPKLVSGISLLASATINAPITVEAPNLVDAAFFLYSAKANAPVNLKDINLIEALDYAYDAKGGYDFDFTYLHEYFDTPEKRKLLSEFQETLRTFNERVSPELSQKGISIDPFDEGHRGLEFIIQGERKRFDTTEMNDDEISEQIEDIPLSDESKQVVEKLLQLQRMLRVKLRKRGGHNLKTAMPLTDYHKFLLDNVSLWKLCTARGINGRDAFRLLADLKALQEGKEIPFPAKMIERAFLKKNIMPHIAEVAHYAGNNTGAVELIQRTICK